jgi:CHAT domain-containing protein
MLRIRMLAIAAMLGALGSGAAHAQFSSPILADSFRLGSGGGTLCQVQTRGRDPAVRGIFDRAWYIVCRDAARPIGKIFSLRGSPADIASRLAGLRATDATCTGDVTKEAIPDAGNASIAQCKLVDAEVGYRVLSVTKGGTVWVAEGLAGYDSALRLGLRTVMTDRFLPGQVTVAVTSVDDPVAFARVQAGTLDPDQALAEGYRRNNSGNYAEAAEFFDTLQQRNDSGARNADRAGEYLINRALQKSNLGEFAEADKLLEQARAIPTADRVQTRLRRNFEILHLLNQQRYDEALAKVDMPFADFPKTSAMPGTAIEIGAQVAAEINAGLPVGQRLGATESSALTPEERAKFLDAQAVQLTGTLLRLKGKPAEGRKFLDTALRDVLEVREGRVVSVIRLRAQILTEFGLALEDEGDLAGAEARMREALATLETRYPQTNAVNGARARLAGFLARHNKVPEAMTEYREVVRMATANRTSITGLGNLLAPYFSLLSQQIPTNAALVEDMFLAGQTLIRPGVADTQAILSRELSEGDGDAARLFRQARTLERDIERSRVDLATLLSSPNQSPDVQAAAATIRNDIASLERDQASTQAQLAAFPQFQAISNAVVTLDEVKASLKPGEAYFKTSIVGKSIYALFVDGDGATGYRVPISSDALDRAVDGLRDTIAKEENGQLNTYAFDVKLARRLYVALMGPVADRVTRSKHLIFEPDGALLRLPPNLLVTSQESADAYAAKTAKPDADQFDFRGVAWLGRNRGVSTALSVRGFRDARNTPASNATRDYIGFGQNAPLEGPVAVASTRRMIAADSAECLWPKSEWNKPISAEELREVRMIIGAPNSELVTDGAFSDTAIVSRKDLSDYRIVHFATHGLVTAPRPECPARPALLTSFGSGDSDGLLTFKEIFDLRLNADLVLLSACDTAGKATVAATREAGVTTGGGSALDGLVRAFIGAGGRSILASHWPAPDDFNATRRLITGMFQAGKDHTIADALSDAQAKLMDDPETSHPFYWSGFAIVGDGGRALLPPKAAPAVASQ